MRVIPRALALPAPHLPRLLVWALLGPNQGPLPATSAPLCALSQAEALIIPLAGHLGCARDCIRPGKRAVGR